MSRGGGAPRGGGRGGGGGGGGGFASSSAFASAYASTPDLGHEPVQAPLKKTKELELAPVGLFRKDVSCSGRTPIKSSQAKKFKQLVADVYRHLSEAELLQLFPAKCAIHTEKLAGALLTEHKPLLYWVRDESLPAEGKNDIGAPLFVDLSGGHADAHMLWPTIYALAKVPSILRPIVTHPAVSRFAMQGADIMWPGVITPPDAEFGVGRFQQGEKRAVFARGNPVPYAVGWLSQDSPSVVSSGKKGKAVSVVHVYADSLWVLGSREAPNVGFTPKQVYAITMAGGAQSDSDDEEAQGEEQGEEAGVEGPSEGTEAVEAALSDLQVGSVDAASSSPAVDAAPSDTADAVPASSDDDATATAATAGDEEPDADASGAAEAAAEESGSDSDADGDDAQVSASPEVAEDANEVDQVEEGEEGEGEGEEDEEEDDSGGKANTSEMDDALLRCFLLAVQTRIRDSDLPLSSSALLTIMESCNAGGGAVDRLEVKRSRYKKLARFIKALGKMGLAKSKMPLCKKGTCVQELTVMSVSRTSPLMQEVTVTQSLLDAMKKKQKALEKAHKSAAAGKKSSSSASSSSSSSSSSGASSSGTGGGASSSGAASAGANKGALQIIHMYKPDQKLQKYFFTGEDDGKKLWSMKDAKQVLWDYTKVHELDVAGGQRVRLDPALSSTFYPESAARNLTDVAKHDLSSRFDAHMLEYHAIVLGDSGADLSEAKFVKGPVPCIEVSVEQRQGKKQMTKVQGVEIFGIAPAVFARDAQKAFSCSATTASVTVKHKTFEEVLIQGNVAGDVGIKLQQLYGIPQQLVKMQKKGK